MESYYLFLVILLFVLAAADLVIGVSNDAVNFLNSSLGSRVAKRNFIMIIASAGILIGAVTSSGMMEIAQKGVFRPGMFYFDEIMVIFIAVMLTDIILLDFFNTFGLPTSTTVSIVFELLGAATALSIYKIIGNSDNLFDLGEYINGENALLIISGIFLSVLIAFSVGLIVQYISRILFTFHYEKKMRLTAPIFGAVAITAITYFLVVKGLKSSGLISVDQMEWIKSHMFVFIGVCFLFWILVTFVLSFLKVNILRVVVLAGTFSLAMAFAGNDLVNFIGVAIGGLTSYEAFAASGKTAEAFNMEVLNNPVQSNTWILILAGLVMVLTLWFSKKARSVTETEINLGRQGLGAERFKPNLLSRFLVRGGVTLGNVSGRVVPSNVKSNIDDRFYPRQNEVDPPAFDLVRASVNLMVASILIVIATSFKLPLSTTYVSFMVAMGASLADRAWDRDSAVFRVSGVLHVIGGWLFTAIIAFSVAAIFALIIYKTHIYGVVFLTLLAIFLLFRNTLKHQQKVKDSKIKERPLFLLRNPDEQTLFNESKNEIQFSINLLSKTYKQSLKGLIDENRKNLKKAKKKSDDIQELSNDLNRAFLYHLRNCENKEAIHMQYFISVIGQVQHLSQITDQIATLVSDYVENQHRPLNRYQKKALDQLDERLKLAFKKLDQSIEENSYDNLKDVIVGLKNEINQIQKMIIDVFDQNYTDSPKLNYLLVNIYIRTIDMINASIHLADYYAEFISSNSRAEIQED